MEEFVPFGGGTYQALLALLWFAGGMDLLSTWVASPRLELEANPLLRRLGWRFGVAAKILLGPALAFWPFPAVIVITTTVMVAARNFHSAWLSRSMGEARYRCWMTERVAGTHFGLYLFCLFGETSLVALIGAAVAFFGQEHWASLGLGFGLMTYSLAVVVYSLPFAWRLRRMGQPGSAGPVDRAG
jgi:hypothetical protein